MKNKKVIGRLVFINDRGLQIGLAKIDCPYCGNVHTHGAGNGHRVAHCLQKSEENTGYFIEMENTDGA